MGSRLSAFLYDTNILIDALNEIDWARAELAAAKDRWISRISWIEVMVGGPEKAMAATERFLSRFRIVDLNEDIARRAALIRRGRRQMKLPDAIILASAQAAAATLVTRNSKDFPEGMTGVRLPYHL
jgi:predicted nucleic acid-binding protein